MTGRLPIVGDPASVSRTGSVMSRSGARLADGAAAVVAAFSAGEDSWVGVSARSARERVTALDDATRATAAELTTMGSAVQTHAAALAAALAQLRAIAGRIEAAGLRMEDGHVVPTPGLRGEADAADEQELRRAQAALTADLTAVLRDFRTSRTQLRVAMGRSQERLTDIASVVRRGPATR